METAMKPVRNGRRRWSAEQKLAMLQERRAYLPSTMERNGHGSAVRMVPPFMAASLSCS